MTAGGSDARCRGRRRLRGVGARLTAALAVVAACLCIAATDYRAEVIGILKRAIHKELGLELGLDDLGYDIFNKRFILTGVTLARPEEKPFARTPRVILAADIFAMVGGSEVHFDLVMIERGKLRWNAAAPPVEGKPRDTRARIVTVKTFVIKDSRLVIHRDGKTVVTLDAVDLTAKKLVVSKEDGGRMTGTFTATAKVSAEEVGVADHPMEIRATLGSETVLELRSLAGGCRAEERVERTGDKSPSVALERMLRLIETAASRCED